MGDVKRLPYGKRDIMTSISRFQKRWPRKMPLPVVSHSPAVTLCSLYSRQTNMGPCFSATAMARSDKSLLSALARTLLQCHPLALSGLPGCSLAAVGWGPGPPPLPTRPYPSSLHSTASPALARPGHGTQWTPFSTAHATLLPGPRSPWSMPPHRCPASMSSYLTTAYYRQEKNGILVSLHAGVYWI